ncbi:hypothetical protein SLEP1_g50256 [Rubroshorea leprosula]|uniref:Uncharacterized protein n=1 Tax=Rubroshorea leprosula TaxID=152421 RepID=A0AAV5LZI6_9ROSI|nr:hypothetical protein SLEP1_g50256 [Rubroshorea leprosula]
MICFSYNATILEVQPMLSASPNNQTRNTRTFGPSHLVSVAFLRS